MTLRMRSVEYEPGFKLVEIDRLLEWISIHAFQIGPSASASFATFHSAFTDIA